MNFFLPLFFHAFLQGKLDKVVTTALSKVHSEVLDKFYGCGSPIPPMLQVSAALSHLQRRKLSQLCHLITSSSVGCQGLTVMCSPLFIVADGESVRAVKRSDAWRQSVCVCP